jgi:hypothetical protein
LATRSEQVAENATVNAEPAETTENCQEQASALSALSARSALFLFVLQAGFAARNVQDTQHSHDTINKSIHTHDSLLIN